MVGGAFFDEVVAEIVLQGAVLLVGSVYAVEDGAVFGGDCLGLDDRCEEQCCKNEEKKFFHDVLFLIESPPTGLFIGGLFVV